MVESGKYIVLLELKNTISPLCTRAAEESHARYDEYQKSEEFYKQYLRSKWCEAHGEFVTYARVLGIIEEKMKDCV